MKPYINIKLPEYPDIVDIIVNGMKSSTGKFIKIGGDFSGYCKPKVKRKMRRYLKRRDKALTEVNKE